MHSLLAGFMGFFMGVTSMFHGGATPVAMNHTDVTVSGTPASPSGTMRMNGKGPWNQMKLPAGEQPFFGTVTAVNGSTLTIQMMGMMTMHPMMDIHNPHMTVTTTPSPRPSMAPKMLTIDLTSSTTYTGGSQSDIAVNTKVAGVGTSNSDGSITALKLAINPTPPVRPSGFPHRPMPTSGQ